MKHYLKISLLFVLIVIALTDCAKKESKTSAEDLVVNAGFREFVKAYTTGTVKSRTKIRIDLSEAAKQEVTSGDKVDDKLFSFKPSIAGEAVWVSPTSIEFTPSAPLASGTVYQGQFHLSKLLSEASELGDLPIVLQVIQQSFKVEIGTLKPLSDTEDPGYQFEGTLQTADEMDDESVEKLLKATSNGNPLEIKWQHNVEENKHVYTVVGIQRAEMDGSFLLTWDGAVLDIEEKGSEQIEIPGLSNFKVMDIKVFHLPEQYVQIAFSELLAAGQNLAGLISIDKTKDLKYFIDGNTVKVFPQVRLSGEKQISIHRSVRDAEGHKMPANVIRQITFQVMKPNVRLLGKGTILPDADGLILPFQAINLNAIDVRVIKIFEDNIPQFLQVNDADGDYQLKRVGKLIKKKKIELSSEKILDYGKWNSFSLNLSDLIKADPGAIYRIELDFKRSYSLYPCPNAVETEVEEEDWNETEQAEITNWDDWNYYGGYSYYNWREREDPCSDAYYRNKSVARNILSSNIGIIAKEGKDNALKVAVTNIKTTEALAGVTIELYNYAQQLVTSGKTDDQGFVTLEIESRPFLLIAKSGNQRGYLKLSDGSSLSLSKFDVGGSIAQKGVKGMIYGERGVWRPGDSIYTTFILEDKLNNVPDNHPVIFELIDPNGKLTERKIKTSGVNNFYSFPTKTEDDAPTGNWTARVRLGSVVFTKTLRIETVKPNRLKINMDFGTERLKLAEPIKGQLEVKWLHGAIAGNLKAKVDMTVQKTKTQFNKYGDFEFDDPSVDFYKEDKTVFEERINEQGKASINSEFKTNQKAPGMMKATFLTKVFEEGGDFSVDQFSIPCLAYDQYVGLKVPKGDKVRGMLLTDKQHQIDVVTVDAEGEPISVKDLKAEVYKVQWRWWWSSGSDNLASYIGRNSVIPVVKKSFDTNEGHGNFSFEIKYPEWGRYLIKIISPNGHSAGKIVYIDWPGWAGRAQKDNPGGASMLVFSADKTSYEVGETAEISFPSSAGGRALLSIESGSSVLQQKWVPTGKDQTKVNFDLTKEMAPNVYVSISLLQPHAQGLNDLPIRMYGVIPLMVHDPATIIHPYVSMPDVLEPEKKVSIEVGEKDGKPMTFTLAVVDEGLLDLTRFKTPDPWKNFYAREALSVKTWDMFDDVFGAFGVRIEQEFAIGGDENLLDESSKKAKRFKPVVTFFGPYSIGSKEKKKLSFTMPRYVGSVKTMVVASNMETNAYGNTEKVTPVRSPLMLLATLPRVLSPQEKVKLPVTLFAMEENIKEVTVEVTANKFFELPSGTTQKITFDKVGEQDIKFDMVVTDLLGVGKVELTAKSGAHKATYEIELDVRPPNPEKTTSQGAIINPNESWSIPVSLFGIKGTNKAVMEVSGMPSFNLDQRLHYLLRYPYGCIEQTVSSAFPQLYLDGFVERGEALKATTKENVEAALKRLLSFQLSSGSFSYWPGQNYISDWGTIYAGHFMIEAEKHGYQLPYGLKMNWLNSQKKAANRWSENEDLRRSDLIQAYRLFTLALANEADLGAMNRLKESGKLSLSGKYMLALAYVVSGNEAAAKSIINNLQRSIAPYKEWSYTYGSSDRDQAIVLETLLALKMYDEAMPMIQRMAQKLSSDSYMSTQTTAFSLRVMAKAAELFKKSVGEFKFSYQIAEGKQKAVMCTELINHFQLDVTSLDGKTLTIENNSKSPLYFTLALSGVPLLDNGDAIEKNLKMSVEYRDVANKRINISELQQGTDFMAVINIIHPGLLDSYKELALTSMFPSGWEIINSRLFETGGAVESSIPNYQDIRDDRVDTFFDLLKGKSKTFVIHLNAAYEGEYYLPAVQCGAMYDDDIQVRIPGQRVKVVK